MTLRLLTEHQLEFLSLERGCTGSSESTLVKIPHCWKSHVMAHILALSLKNLIVSHGKQKTGQLAHLLCLIGSVNI